MKLYIDGFYTHKETGNLYQVIGFSNMKSEDHSRFPPTVIYEQMDGSLTVWSRPITEFANKFELDNAC